MGKDLAYQDDNTRNILFEKYERYYYNTEQRTPIIVGGFKICLELCMVHQSSVRIGSDSCQECIYNKNFNTEENFVICNKIKQATKK